MANYSEAKGTIVVRAKTKEILEKFIYLHVFVNKELLAYTKFNVFEDLYAANEIKFEDVTYGILYQGEYALIRRDQEVIYEICAEYDYDCKDENIEKFGFKGWS